ncbi:MAG: endo-1,4-beta-xylanase [Bacteroidia bacterium]
MPFRSLLICVALLTACVPEYNSDCNTEGGLYENVDFKIGTAVAPLELKFNQSYSNLVKDQFNQITPGNAFKPDALQPIQGSFSFNQADELVTFALENHKQIHGHCLVWHNQIPFWLKEFSGSKEQWVTILEKHIKTVVRHFGENVKAWDVVNEAFEDDGSYRETIWYKNIGKEYIQLAFEFAHKANPNALLFYNDYNIAAKTKKCEAILEHLNELVENGVPVHGIGMQLHISINYPSESKIETAAKTIANNGFLVHFSEVDVSVNPNGGGVNLSDRILNRQSEKYVQLAEIYKMLPVENQYAFTTWGVSDLDSWIPSYFGREDYPLLFDYNYEPKPAYCALNETLGQ